MNPEARGVSTAVERVVQAALEARFKLDVTQTYAPDSGIEVARGAVESGCELVIAFGGDGLVNEVVNGISGTGALLAIIPGGTMNVFARNLGLPNDPTAATDLILQRAGKAEPLRVVLGAAGDRLFTFVCGCGFDAETVEWVEGHKHSKKRFGEPYFYAAGFLTFLNGYMRKDAFLTCEGSFGTRAGVGVMALSGPSYAYLAGRPVRFVRPEARVPGMLDLFVLEKMRLWHLPIYGVGALFTGRFGPKAAAFAGLDQVRVTSDVPFLIHVDGEPLPHSNEVLVRAGAGEIGVVV